MAADQALVPVLVGRYALYGTLASGGMATVHVGKLMGQAGFVRTVAVKRLRAEYARNPDFVAMFVDEARLVGRIRHPNVVPTLDVVVEDGELFLVMDYVHGESLSLLLRRTVVRQELIDPDIVASIFCGVLGGLHAAHEAAHPKRGPLGIVHRDVSPQNILVGVDGTARVLDFGVAKALYRLQTTQHGMLKGKVRYMSPEQMLGEAVSRRSDVYSAAVVMWETLTARPLFLGGNEQETRENVLLAEVLPPSRAVPSGRRTVNQSAWQRLLALDEVVLRGLAREPGDRYATARDFARAIEAAVAPAPSSAVGAWVEEVADEAIRIRAARLAEAGDQAPRTDPPPNAPPLGPPQSGGGSTSARPPLRTGAAPPTAPKPLAAVWIGIAAAGAAVFLLLVVAAMLLVLRR